MSIPSKFLSEGARYQLNKQTKKDKDVIRLEEEVAFLEDKIIQLEDKIAKYESNTVAINSSEAIGNYAMGYASSGAQWETEFRIPSPHDAQRQAAMSARQYELQQEINRRYSEIMEAQMLFQPTATVVGTGEGT